MWHKHYEGREVRDGFPERTEQRLKVQTQHLWFYDLSIIYFNHLVLHAQSRWGRKGWGAILHFQLSYVASLAPLLQTQREPTGNIAGRRKVHRHNWILKPPAHQFIRTNQTQWCSARGRNFKLVLLVLLLGSSEYLNTGASNCSSFSVLCVSWTIWRRKEQ